PGGRPRRATGSVDDRPVAAPRVRPGALRPQDPGERRGSPDALRLRHRALVRRQGRASRPPPPEADGRRPRTAPHRLRRKEIPVSSIVRTTEVVLLAPRVDVTAEAIQWGPTWGQMKQGFAWLASRG